MIEDKLYSALSDGKYKADIERGGRILIDIGLMYLSELDETQSVALDIAQRFWDDRIKFDHKRLCYLEVLCDRMDKFLRNREDESRLATLNRIVASSLMTTSGLSYHDAEFIADLAQNLSVPEAKLDEVFSKHIPEYRK